MSLIKTPLKVKDEVKAWSTEDGWQHGTVVAFVGSYHVQVNVNGRLRVYSFSNIDKPE